jgi:hypothetical protein
MVMKVHPVSINNIYIDTLRNQPCPEKVLNPLNHTPAILPKEVPGSIGVYKYLLWICGFSYHGDYWKLNDINHMYPWYFIPLYING